MTERQRYGDPFAGIPGRRLFVAVPLSGDAAAAVVRLVEGVRGQGLPTGMHDVRWVRLDGLHLTLRFLGPTPDDRIEPTAQAVRLVAARTTPIDALIAGTGTFPAGPRPRTLFLDLAEGAGPLADLTADLGTALLEAGWPAEARPFRAHLTLARSDGLAAGPLVAGRLADGFGSRTIPARIDAIGLFESLTGGGPARYLPIEVAALTGS